MSELNARPVVEPETAPKSGVRYSICVCNYNMADTIARALTSVLDQVDDNFEVLVVDDGSSDNSVEVLESLAKKYPTLRYIALKRDSKRLLGETRNISIREARGEYVLPQFDCDDVYEPCVTDFVKVFHQIESCIGKEFYLKGNKLNMGKKSFLLKYGPYRNTFKEDRDMWIRLASDEVLIPLKHKQVHVRLPKTKPVTWRRALFKSWAHLQSDYRSGLEFWNPVKMLFARRSNRDYKVRILRCIYMPFAWITAKFREPLLHPDNFVKGSFKEYWLDHEGTFVEHMRRYKGEIDNTEFSAAGKSIFYILDSD